MRHINDIEYEYGIFAIEDNEETAIIFYEDENCTEDDFCMETVRL